METTDLILDNGTLDLIEQLASNELSILDTETTGFTKQCQVIEMSILSSTIEELKYTSLFHPSTKIQYGARKVHGIGLGQLIGKPLFGETEFDKWFPLIEDTLLTGWNLAFDYRLICQTLEAWDAYYCLARWKEYYQYNTIDMMDIVKRLTGKGRISQSTALALFKVPLVDSDIHRATADCLNLNALIRRLQEIAKID